MIPGLADEALKSERLSNAERQRRFRERRRNARNGIVTDDNGKPNSSLTRIAHNLAAGMTPHQALIQAGSSPKAVGLIDKCRQGLAEIMKEKGLTTTKVVESIVQDFDATETVIKPGGECIERPSTQLRPAARRDAIALLDRAGELPAVQGSLGAGHLELHFHVHRPDVSQHGADNEAIHKRDAQVIDITAQE